MELLVLLLFVLSIFGSIMTLFHTQKEIQNLFQPKPPVIQYDCKSSFCSWQNLRSEIPTQTLKKDANSLIKYNLNPADPQLACFPSLFEYKAQDAIRLFPPRKFQKCTQNLTSSIQFNIQTEKFTLNCPGTYKGQYVLGDSHYKEKQGRYRFQKNMKPYTGQVQLSGTQQFVYASCNQNFNSAQHVFYTPRTKLKVKTRVQKQMKTKQQELDPTQQTKPLIIFHLLVDSLSRSHFYRNFPKTIQFLNSLPQSKLKIFDFKINNVMGNNSPPNIIPYFTGRTEYQQRRDATSDFLGPNSLYSLIRDNGFVTMLGTEYCHRYYSWYMGEQLNVDHIMSSFWCAAVRYSGYWDISKDRRCIGQQYSHKHMLDYSLNFTLNYKGLNQWIFLDFLTAHQDSGTVIRTLDEDLVEFLEKFLKNQQDFVLFFEADHGMRYGDWFRLIQGGAQHKLPLLLTLTSQGVIDRIPNSQDILDHNSYRLVSKFDLRLTDLHLSIVPYTSKITPQSEIYKEWISQTESSGNAVSLALEKIPNTRKCEDINIPSVYCSCHQWKIQDQWNRKEFFDKLATEAIWQMNYIVRNPRTNQFDICESVSLKQVIRVQQQVIDQETSNFKMILTVKEFEYAKIEVVIMVSKKRMRFLSLWRAFGTYPFYGEGKQFIQVMHIRRLDPFAGMCQDIAYYNYLKEEFCFCKDLKTCLANSNKNLVHFLRSRYIPVQTNGKDCKEACLQVSGTCVGDYSFQLYDNQQWFSQQSFGECKLTNKIEAPYIKGDECYISVDSKIHRGRCSVLSEKKRVCPCLRSLT